MKVLIISGPNSARAGIVAFDLNRNLNRSGHDCRLLTLYDRNAYDNVILMHNPVSWFLTSYYIRDRNRFKRTFLNGDGLRTNPRYYFHDLREDETRFSTKALRKKIPFTPDVIVALFTYGFINTKNMHELSAWFKAPVLWYLMDMGPMTGGCHYAWDCDGYKNSCGHCPGLYSREYDDFSHRNLLFKQSYLQRTPLIAIAATEWLDRQVHASALFRDKPVHKILLSCNPDIFKPAEKAAARAGLNLPQDQKIIFFGSVNLDEERKGMAYLVEALGILRQRLGDVTSPNSVHCLIAGHKDEGLLREMPLPFTHVGTLGNDRELASAYQAADLFVCPSIEDSGPSMINQAIMSGTPVVSFEMGVAPDLVHTGITGYRARLKDSLDLAEGMFRLLHLPIHDYRVMSRNCRALGIERCHPEVQARQFSAIMEFIGHHAAADCPSFCVSEE
jgi:glycosyltransferase involved in cell wall biosynthesis